MNTSLQLPVSDLSMAGEARRLASHWTRERGGNEIFIANVALVVTELANNLAKHTRGGVILLRVLTSEETWGVEILSLDAGPGVANFQECLRDGHSTAGTSGIGLGAVLRASHAFEVHSQPGIGTALRCELWPQDPVSTKSSFVAGGVSTALNGQDVSGDSWASQQISPTHYRLMIADGLGHGVFAAEASRKAVEVFLEGSNHPLPRLLENIHGALRATRGAAAAIAEIDLSEQQLRYAGIGNIAATVLQSPRNISLVSHNGTLGAQWRSIQQFSYPWEPGGMLIMHSDGLKTGWQVERYQGLLGKHPALIAGVLYRDFQRPNDDSTVIGLRTRLA